MPRAPRTFKGAGASSPRARRRAYDKFRPSAAKRLYGRAWRKARAGFLWDNPWCRICRDDGKHELAVEVDHIVPHEGDEARFWDRDNWQGLCRSCHSAKTCRDMARRKRRRVGGDPD